MHTVCILLEYAYYARSRVGKLEVVCILASRVYLFAWYSYYAYGLTRCTVAHVRFDVIATDRNSWSGRPRMPPNLLRIIHIWVRA